MNTRKSRQNRGSALIFALVVLFVLSLGTSVLWRQLHINLEQHRRVWHGEQAFQLAEAGLDHALAALRASGGTYRGDSEVPLGPGSFSVTITPENGPGTFMIVAWGQIKDAAYRHDRHGLQCRLRIAPNGEVLEYHWERVRGEGL